MIAFGCAITDEDTYGRLAEPGLQRTLEGDSILYANVSAGSIFRNYNQILKQAREVEGLEALVLLHQDAIIEDPDFLAKVRAAVAEPEVAIVGCAGALDVRNIAWWEGSVKWAAFSHRYDEMGGGEIAGMNWYGVDAPAFAGLGDVQTVDGFVLIFTPWAIENLNFDESLPGGLHGYDFDICMQARQAGRKVVTAPLRVVHHHSLTLISEKEGWIEAHIKLAEKWNGLVPDVGGDWRARARRAEAELAVTRLQTGAGRLILEQRIGVLERELEGVERSISWRLTRPLRWLSKLFGRSTVDPD